MFSPRPLKWPITATSLLIFFIPLLLPTATLATTNTRAKPVVMPFAFDYGNGGYGGWYSIPVTIGVGGAQVNLSISTSLSQSWIIGASICDNDTNKTACLLSRGGVYDPVKSPSWTALDSAKKDVKMTSELESGVYADIKVEVDATKDVLGLKGAGTIGIDKVALKSNTGLFELEKQRIGVFESEAPASNGVLSLQQMALGLYAAGNTASPTVHVLTGGASESYADYRTTPDLSYGDYMLIFGGYDRSIIDLNLTQQYPIHMTNLKGQKKRDEVPLPPSEATGYRLQLEIDRLIYRWTRGGDTDNDILFMPTQAIIDTTTPYLWLPPKAVDALVGVTGATWNSSLNAYSYRYCFSDCNTAEETSSKAVLDFVFPQQKLTLSFRDYFKLETLLDPNPSSGNWKFLPVRKLESENSPIILGRAVMAGVHLWVDYADRYFGMVQHNISAIPKPDIFSWSRSEHPPITNTSIIATKLPDSTSSGSSGGTGLDGNVGSKKSASPISKAGIISAVAAGCAAVVLILGVFCFLRHRRRESRHTIPYPPPSADINAVSYGRHELHNESNTASTDLKQPYYQLAEAPAHHHIYSYPSTPHTPAPPHAHLFPSAPPTPASPSYVAVPVSLHPGITVNPLGRDDSGGTSGHGAWGYAPHAPPQYAHEVAGCGPETANAVQPQRAYVAFPPLSVQYAVEMPANSWDRGLK